MRQCEFKKRYDPDLGMYVKKHIYGEGITDVFKAVGNKLFGETAKSIVKTAAKSAATKAATKTGEYAGEYAGKKAGDKIVKLLSKNKTTVLPVTTSSPSVLIEPTVSASEKLTPDEINDRVNMLLSGGMLRRKNFM